VHARHNASVPYLSIDPPVGFRNLRLGPTSEFAENPLEGGEKMRNSRTILIIGLLIVCSLGLVLTMHFRNAEALSGEDGRVINLSVGQTYTVTLDSNPSTGYSWTATFAGQNIRLVNQEFTSTSTLLGASGKEAIEFEALAVGTTEVRFAYQRPWEGNAERVITYRFVVK
jgi:predicted secreted protein